MIKIDVPFQKLFQFQEKLNITPPELMELEPYREIFIRKKDEFAEHFASVFMEFPDTRILIEFEERPLFLKKIWAYWFASFFSRKFDDDFLSYLWKIGMRHVEVNLDQRFSNLGFSVVRQFCHRLIQMEVPQEKAAAVTHTIDKLLDLCLLVETSAYIEATVRCDVEVIRGLADRVRNPVAVIGGSIRRIQKAVEAGRQTQDLFDSVVSENRRLEAMVTDVKRYFEVFEGEPEQKTTALEPLIRSSLDTLKKEKNFDHVTVDITISPEASSVRGDPRDFAYLFYYLLQNSIEAVDPANPLIRITAQGKSGRSASVAIEIFNTGRPPRDEDLDKIFSPFYSTKTMGTGFGLPIAQLALKKNFGTIEMEPVAGNGTRIVITLPNPDAGNPAPHRKP